MMCLMAASAVGPYEVTGLAGGGAGGAGGPGLPGLSELIECGGGDGVGGCNPGRGVVEDAVVVFDGEGEFAVGGDGPLVGADHAGEEVLVAVAGDEADTVGVVEDVGGVGTRVDDESGGAGGVELRDEFGGVERVTVGAEEPEVFAVDVDFEVVEVGHGGYQALR